VKPTYGQNSGQNCIAWLFIRWLAYDRKFNNTIITPERQDTVTVQILPLLIKKYKSSYIYIYKTYISKKNRIQLCTQILHRLYAGKKKTSKRSLIPIIIIVFSSLCYSPISFIYIITFNPSFLFSLYMEGK